MLLVMRTKSITMKQTRKRTSRSSHSMVQAFFMLILSARTRGYASECYNCYSTDKEGCMNPYYGRYAYNSNILIPDCNYDMSRNFHSSFMYVLTIDAHEAMVTKVDEGYIKEWDRLTSVHSFYCCKALFKVSVANKPHRYVVRGCCSTPSTYDQCRETKKILKNLTTITPKNTTYILEHCSTCGSDRCNSSPISLVQDVVCTMFAIVTLRVATQRWGNSATSTFL